MYIRRPQPTEGERAREQCPIRNKSFEAWMYFGAAGELLELSMELSGHQKNDILAGKTACRDWFWLRPGLGLENSF